MKVLWFTNTFLPDQPGKFTALTSSGGWMNVLMDVLATNREHEFAVASVRNHKKILQYYSNSVNVYSLPKKKFDFFIHEKSLLRSCCEVIDNFRPNLIHIHGTEGFYGLLSARNLVSCPVIISLQGLLGPCSEWYHYFGNRSLLDVVRMHRCLEIPVLRGHLMGFAKIRRSAKREKEIIQGNRFFIGRTDWDKSYVQALNPGASYFHGGELLREPFWQKIWRINHAKRHRIIFTNAGHPRKGTETLLDAVSLLLPDYPNIQVAIAGSISRRSGYGRYIRNRLNVMCGTAVELGPLDAEQMARELACSHVFVSPSYIDNSPNAVCEAQLIGMPIISTYTGGVPSLIDNGCTGLFYPTGDASMLAYRIRQVFENDELACRLGRQSREVAIARHDPDTVVNQIISAYESVLRLNSSANSLKKGHL